MKLRAKIQTVHNCTELVVYVDDAVAFNEWIGAKHWGNISMEVASALVDAINQYQLRQDMKAEAAQIEADMATEALIVT